MPSENKSRESHGESKGPRSLSTGRRSSPEYRVWMGLIARCSTHPEYAGRGITVCDSWRNSFSVFLNNMGRRPSPKHSIDRIDNNGSYNPENCRWATRTQQNRNVRTNQLITENGETKCVSEWALQLGISAKTIYTRIARGHDPFISQRKGRSL